MWTDRQTTMMKLIVALRNFANASKNENDVLKIRRIEGKILLSHIPGIDFLNLFFFLCFADRASQCNLSN